MLVIEDSQCFTTTPFLPLRDAFRVFDCDSSCGEKKHQEKEKEDVSKNNRQNYQTKVPGGIRGAAGVSDKGKGASSAGSGRTSSSTSAALSVEMEEVDGEAMAGHA